MTPSGWHDDARGRDAGHDVLQVEVYQWCKNRKFTLISVPATSERSGYVLSHRETTFEEPLYSKRHDHFGSQIIAFADVAEMFFIDPQRGLMLAVLYEIKPRIESIGALVRQCRAVRHAFNQGYGGVPCYVLPVVPYDDPKLPLLREVSKVIPWRRDEPVDTEDYPRAAM